MRVCQVIAHTSVFVALLATTGCGTSQPISWRVAMVRDYREPLIVNIKWPSALLPPTVQTKSLATMSQRTGGQVDGLWVASNAAVYATWEAASWDSSLDQFVRVYSRDGTMLAEYKGPPEDHFVTSPMITEEGKSVVFITGNGRVMVGASPSYSFKALPERLPLNLNGPPESSKIYEIDGEHVVFGMELYTEPVYRVSLRDGSWEEIAKASLLGTYQGMPIVSSLQSDGTFHVRVLGGKFPKPGRMMRDGFGGYHCDMVNRISPCGEYYLYDAAGLTGFRLKLAVMASPNTQVTLSSLGRVTSVGSWWIEAASTTQPSGTGP